MKRYFINISVVLTLSLQGCMITPRARTSDLSIPATWSTTQDSKPVEEGAPATAHPPAELTRWWTTLSDPLLLSLVDRAVQANLDVREAEARIREARASRTVVAADAWPSLNASGIYTRSRRSENVISTPSSVPGGGSSSNLFGFGGEQDFFQSSFDASWELDVFGRVRWSVEAAEANIAAAEESRGDVLVALLADVARNYVELRGFQYRLAIAHENIAAQEESLEIARVRFQAGVTSALDAAEAQSLLASTRAQVPPLERGAQQTIHRLGILLGQPPGTLLAELSPQASIPQATLAGTIGLPSDLLRRRPDIRRAERELAAATARIGVAAADLFPRFSLTGALGLQSLDVTDLAEWPSRFWTAGGAIRWPIFDAGRIRANIRVQDARQEQALARYERTILQSFEEVENALVGYAREQERRQLLIAAVQADREALELASERYTGGLTDFLNVILAQRALYGSQDALAQNETSVIVQLLTLYKALGGGWEVYPPSS
ncbi:MAG: efflux transporter outer membrane subunit [Deltaproteobacteria bacterium]|nr:efflux transporter outer membrane subunit [Deltaproteobacteria bacterium]